MSDASMTPERAQQILGAGAAASSDERHRIFAEKRALFEKKLGQAPTPGLQAKYRDALDELTRAFELLETAQIDQDLGSVRPDLKPAAAPRPGSEVARGVPAPPPNAANPNGLRDLPGHRGASSPKSQREFRLALLGVAVVVVLLGGWWWKQSADATTEHARQEELAKQEAIARTARNEAERAAAETKAAALRNEDDKSKELERRTIVTLAELKTHFDGLDQTLKEVDRTIADARSAERDLAKTGGWELEWVQRRRALMEGYRSWLADHTARHPARVRYEAATRLLQGKDVEGAAGEVAAGAEAFKSRASEPTEHRYSDAGRPLIDWLLGAKEWPDEAFERVRLDESASVARAVDELKTELVYLDDRAKKPTSTDWRGRMQPLGWLTGGNDRDFVRWRPRFVGTITVTSTPSGAEIVDVGGKVVGTTPASFSFVGGGAGQYTVRKAGFKPASVEGRAGLEEEKTLATTLEQVSGPRAGQPFENSLGMKFVPVGGTEVLFCVWETRVQDYEVFSRATNLGWAAYWKATTPAQRVSWEDAQAFCAWLTERERAKGWLEVNQSYRLARDWEWSVAVGLSESRSGSPQSKDGKIDNVYPWGTQWPPPRGAGNYDSSLGVDSFVVTAPVGSFAANRFGIYDLGGNVWEWVEDFYDGSSGGRALRGTSSGGGDRENLLSSFRIQRTPDFRGLSIGFRVVCAVGVASSR